MHARRWVPADWIRLGFLVLFGVLVAAMIYYRYTAAPAAYATPHPGWWFPFGGFWVFVGLFLFFGLARRVFWGPRWWGGWRRGDRLVRPRGRGLPHPAGALRAWRDHQGAVRGDDA